MAAAGFAALWRPALIAAALALGGLYALASRWRGAPEAGLRAAAFAAGLGAGYAALAGPVGALAATGAFSARVCQDVLLSFAAAPLLLAGLPPPALRRLLRPPAARRAAALVCHPVTAVLVFHLLLGICLTPPVMRALAARPWLTAPEAALLLLAAMQMWAPLVVDLPELRAPAPGLQLVYLLFNWLLVTVAFAVLLFGESLPYDVGLARVAPFGLTPDQDRQLGAVLLGLGSHAAYLVALGAIFLRWARQEGSTATPGHVYARLRGGGWTDAEARRIAGLPRGPQGGR